jgi:hypothetical protein
MGGPFIEVNRMSYIDLVNRFWTIDSEFSFSHLEVHLYFKLLEINNRLGWKEKFSVSNGRLCALIGTTQKNLIKARQRLVDKELVGYKKGSTRDAGVYYFPLYMKKESNLETNLESNLGSNLESNPGNINKTRLDKDKDIIYIPAPAIEKVILFWNQFQISRIPENKEKTNAAILKALLDHGEEAVLQAIKNYAEIVNGSEYILKTRWQLSTFLDLHVEKFLDEESAKAMYRAKGGPNGRGEQRDSRDDWKERFKNPAGTHSDERDLEELLVRSETGGG